MAEIIARVDRTKKRPERLALLRPDGTVSNWFAHDETREEIAAALAAAGLVLREETPWSSPMIDSRRSRDVGARDHPRPVSDIPDRD